MTTAIRRLLWQAGAVAIVSACLEIALPCAAWRWPVGAIGVGFSSWVLLRIGPLARAGEVTFEERRSAEFLASCSFLGGGCALLGLLC